VLVNRGTRRKPKFIPVKILDASGMELGENPEETKEELEKARALWDVALRIAKPVSLRHVSVGIETTYAGTKIALGDVTVSIKDKGRYFLVYFNNSNSTATRRLEEKIAQLLSSCGFSKGEYGGYITRGRVNMEQLAKALADLLNQHKDVIEEAMNEDIQGMAEEIAKARAALGINRNPSEELTSEDVLAALGLSQPQNL